MRLPKVVRVFLLIATLLVVVTLIYRAWIGPEVFNAKLLAQYSKTANVKRDTFEKFGFEYLGTRDGNASLLVTAFEHGNYNLSAFAYLDCKEVSEDVFRDCSYYED